MTKPNLERYFKQVLRFVDDGKLYANNQMIAQHLHASHGFGTKVARQMSDRGLLKWLPDVAAWRVSELGRRELNENTETGQK